jgi:hypothetical protein
MSDQSALFERFEYFAEEVYGDSPDKKRLGAFHAAVSLILAEYELTDDDIRDEISFDGAGDGGIDFFFKTEDEPTRIFVMQVKDYQAFAKQDQRQTFLKMKEHVDFLRGKQTAAGLNDINKSRRDTLRANPSGFISYLLVITGEAPANVKAEDLSPDWNVGADFGWQVYDKEALANLVFREVSPNEPKVTITWPSGQMLSVSGVESEQLIHGYLDASTYADATMPFKTDLFRLNPRLFLSTASGYHKGMYETLNNSDEAKRFHLYNNGITAIVKDFTLEEMEGGSTKVICSDFQVVNGCQTTETLWRWRRDHVAGEEPPKVLIPLRIVRTADVSLAEAISRTNNSQSAITSADLIANSARQKQIKAWLEGLPADKFVYEARRGTWGKMTRPQQESYKISNWPNTVVGKNYRRISIRELAQMLLAIHGKPEQAKEAITGWFATEEKQEQLFGEAKSDHQLALIAEMTRVLAKPSNWADREKLQDPNYLHMANLGRFYIAHLIYEYWKSNGVLTFRDDVEYIGTAESKRLRSTIFETLPRLAHLATVSLTFIEPEPNDGLRGLLRKSAYKTRIQTKFKETIALQDAL